jgi:hypothetical protein
MPTTLKCPNPSCPYLFDPSTVPAGVVLGCPRCTMRFTLGAPVSAPAAASHPPPATAAAASRTAGSAFEAMTPEAARADGQEGPRLPVRSSSLQTGMLIGVAALGLAAVGIAIWYTVTHDPSSRSSNPATLFPEQNFSLVEPSSPWAQDGALQGTLGSLFVRVYKRANPDACIAIGVKDFDGKEPRPSELKQPLFVALSRVLMPNTLQRQTIPDGTTWFGRAVDGFNFRGQLKNGSVVEGEAYHVVNGGFGYWFLAWAGENEIYAEQKETFRTFRFKCKFLDERSDRDTKQQSAVRFTNNVIGYSIVDGEGIWREVSDEETVKAEDPRADKYFTAKIKQEGSDFTRDADLVIFVLDGAADPLALARSYVEERENRDVESRGKSIFSEHKEDTSLDEPNPVAGSAPYVLLTSRNTTSEMSRLWAISAIKVGDKIVAACAKCPFTAEDREQFERKFVVLVRSLRAEN